MFSSTKITVKSNTAKQSIIEQTVGSTLPSPGDPNKCFNMQPCSKQKGTISAGREAIVDPSYRRIDWDCRTLGTSKRSVMKCDEMANIRQATREIHFLLSRCNRQPNKTSDHSAETTDLQAHGSCFGNRILTSVHLIKYKLNSFSQCHLKSCYGMPS